jgi:arabinose-5-phosphate isomerase
VGNPNSTLARAADAVLNVAIEREACPLQLAPMASTTATLAMGDALAAVLMEVKGFQPAQFAEFHPGGSLGRKLLVRVADEMIRTELPVCAPDAEIQEVILRMTHGKMGLVVVCEDAQRVVGIITDGDLRRALGKVPQSSFFSLSAQQIMHTSPKTIAPTERAAAADELMTAQKITALLVVDDARNLLGVYHRIH